MAESHPLSRLSTEVDYYLKSVHFPLPGSEIPPPQFAPFLKSCLELFREETLRDFDHQVQSIAELAERYAQEHSEKIRPGTNRVYAHASLGLGTNVIPLYENRFPLDNLGDNLDNYVREMAEKLNAHPLVIEKKLPDLFTPFSATVGATSHPALELYSIELLTTEFAADAGVSSSPGYHALPSIKISASTTNGARRFIDHLIELSCEQARRTYGSLGYPVIETKEGLVPLRDPQTR